MRGSQPNTFELIYDLNLFCIDSLNGLRLDLRRCKLYLLICIRCLLANANKNKSYRRNECVRDSSVKEIYNNNNKKQITISGFPPEQFYRGAQLWETMYGFISAYPLVCFIFVPVYCNLGITSVYQYLDLRYVSHAQLFEQLYYRLIHIITIAKKY